MKLINVMTLKIPEIKVIRVGKYSDHRGYFLETFRKSDFKNTETPFLSEFEIKQVNESYSKQGTIRGLHFQWAPYMGKLVRTLYGRMVDVVLDIRKGSPTFGKAIAYDMPAGHDKDHIDWIWVPPGFAHGGFYPQESAIEYFCTDEWSPKTEAGISPLSSDIDWSMCEKSLKNEFDLIAGNNPLMTEKDKNGFSVESWKKNASSANFEYKNIQK